MNYGQGGQLEHHRTIHNSPNAPPPPPPNRVSSIRERQKVEIDKQETYYRSKKSLIFNKLLSSQRDVLNP